MTENDIFIFLILLGITVIPMCLFICIVITRDINSAIRKCDEIGKWAKEELNRRTK